MISDSAHQLVPRGDVLLVSGARFARMSRNAARATKFFRIPPDRVCELGAQIEL